MPAAYIAPEGLAAHPALAKRRLGFFGTVALLTGFGALAFCSGLLHEGVAPIWIIILAPLFTLLFGTLAFSFTQAITGWLVLARGGDPLRITATVHRSEPAGIPRRVRTAITVPIFNEDVQEVFRRIHVMRRSIEALGMGTQFDFFVLSDSTDPNKWMEEEMAWAALHKGCARNGVAVYYRRRKRPIHQKSGNIADFCRRWGSQYRYMLVLDADSFMTGETITRLVKLMEANPGAGIIQTVPRLAGAETHFARAQQFCFRLFSPLFAAGANFWQQGDATYWGHNAIIRVTPFLKHCALPALPGTGAFGGRILSHDFVEAALMRKAGWSVWTAYDLPGSYEGAPPTILEYLKRDRRWCQGNLQHVALLFERAIPAWSKVHFTSGILAYAASPLLVLFLFVGLCAAWATSSKGDPTISSGVFALTGLMIFGWQLLALGSTLASDFLPKAYGGRRNVALSVILGTFLSTLIAPIFLWHHSRFVVLTLLGKKVTWKTQNRDSGTTVSWTDGIDEHGVQTLTGLVLLGLLATFSPGLLLCFSPLLAGSILAIPVSVLSSRTAGQTPMAKYFRIPEEIDRGGVLSHLRPKPAAADRNPMPASRAFEEDAALARAVIDPVAHAIHTSLLRPRRTGPSHWANRKLATICERLYRRGAAVLSPAEKSAILNDREALQWLHRKLWSTSPQTLPDWWKVARHQVLCRR